MKNDELRDYSFHHLQYELEMLYETAARLVHDRAVLGDIIVKNALIESFAVHARSLAVFLYPHLAHKRKDDVTSDEYVRDPAEWRNARGLSPPELEAVIGRTAKEIAHLTTKRYPQGAPDKAWTPETIVRAFFEPLKRFAEHVPPDRLDAGVRIFIASLPGAPPSGGPYGPGPQDNPEVGYTDLSTP